MESELRSIFDVDFMRLGASGEERRNKESKKDLVLVSELSY